MQSMKAVDDIVGMKGIKLSTNWALRDVPLWTSLDQSNTADEVSLCTKVQYKTGLIDKQRITGNKYQG